MLAIEHDLALDAVDEARFGFTIGAILGVNAGVAQPHRDAGERQLLAPRIEPQRHRRARAEAHEQAFVGIGTGVLAADRARLVGNEPVPAVEQVLSKQALAVFHNDDSTGGHRRLGPGGCGVDHLVSPGVNAGRGRFARLSAGRSRPVAILFRNCAACHPPASTCVHHSPT